MVPSSSPEPEQPTLSLTRAPPPQPDPKPSLEQVRPALGHHLPHRLPRRPLRRDHRARRPRHALLARRSLARAPAPPTHNREPYDTQLSDTMVTHPSVEPMPLSSTRSMRMSVCGVRAPPHGPRTVRAGARLRAVGQAPRAGLVLVEVGVRHVERHSRLRPPDEPAALHALLNDGSRHAGSHPP